MQSAAFSRPGAECSVACKGTLSFPRWCCWASFGATTALSAACKDPPTKPAIFCSVRQGAAREETREA